MQNSHCEYIINGSFHFVKRICIKTCLEKIELFIFKLFLKVIEISFYIIL